jgi:hypothetical protein
LASREKIASAKFPMAGRDLRRGMGRCETK